MTKSPQMITMIIIPNQRMKIPGMMRLNLLTDRYSTDNIFNHFRALKREARKRKWVRRLNFVNDRG